MLGEEAHPQLLEQGIAELASGERLRVAFASAMNIDRFTDLLAVAILGGVLVIAGMWLWGVDSPATTRANRRWSLVYPALIASLAILNAVTADWLMAVALGIWAALEYAMALAPDLPDRLRTRHGSPPAA